MTTDRWCLVASGTTASAAIASAQAIVEGLGLATRRVCRGEEALVLGRASAPALVILGLELSDPSPYEVCRLLRDELGQALPIIIISGGPAEVRDEVAALLLGADDYFGHPLDEEKFAARVRRLLTRAPAPRARSGLTPRELEILSLLAAGRRTPEIARILGISRKTAATHVDHVLSKLGVHSQAQAVALALRERLINQ